LQTALCYHFRFWLGKKIDFFSVRGAGGMTSEMLRHVILSLLSERRRHILAKGGFDNIDESFAFWEESNTAFACSLREAPTK
jgi:hypothetical protein